MGNRLATWLESHWILPAYSGWLLGGLSLFFFVAATNTLAGWLYVISGVSFALLGLAAILPERSLRSIKVLRRPIQPVSVGAPLIVELEFQNSTKQPKTLLQAQDLLPFVLGQPARTVIEAIPAQSSFPWIYHYPTQKRGVYRWQTVQLRTAAPLGLFWCRRTQAAPAMAIVYPTVLPLTRCPLIDELGREMSLNFYSNRRTQVATEGLTRALRPYRWGDPTRLIHWRTSARYGEFRVRELEIFTGGQDIIICLDSAQLWQDTAIADAFEQAVIAAASLYFYALHHRLSVRLWTASTGLVQGSQPVLETLAAVQAGDVTQPEPVPDQPLIWLTHNVNSLATLPPGSRWVLWLPNQTEESLSQVRRSSPGLVVQSEQSLQTQLQTPLTHHSL
jgi:uncharacterized protein (DUF58 family)